MSDGLNNARALRILEIINDFRTLQVHIRTHITRMTNSPPSDEERSLTGYQVLARCQVAAQAILAASFNPGNFQPGQMAETDAQKQVLQRVILDASARRFKAHKIYLQVSSVVRWVAGRAQVLRGQRADAKHAVPLRTLDQRLVTELTAITEDHVYRQLRTVDQNKGYWLNDDPSLAQVQQFLQSM